MGSGLTKTMWQWSMKPKIQINLNLDLDPKQTKSPKRACFVNKPCLNNLIQKKELFIERGIATQWKKTSNKIQRM